MLYLSVSNTDSVYDITNIILREALPHAFAKLGGSSPSSPLPLAQQCVYDTGLITISMLSI